MTTETPPGWAYRHHIQPQTTGVSHGVGANGAFSRCQIPLQLCTPCLQSLSFVLSPLTPFNDRLHFSAQFHLYCVLETLHSRRFDHSLLLAAVSEDISTRKLLPEQCVPRSALSRVLRFTGKPKKTQSSRSDTALIVTLWKMSAAAFTYAGMYTTGAVGWNWGARTCTCTVYHL